MKRIKLVFIYVSVILASLTSRAQTTTWTADELKQANTAKDFTDFNIIEKETLLYINLARLYPKKFVEIELKDYDGPTNNSDYLKNSPYKKTLITTLKTNKAVNAMVPDKSLTEFAKCFAIEQGKSGKHGHARHKCKDGNFAECVSYGMDNGKDIAMQLLIDHSVSSLGHRKICLDKNYSHVGISFGKHKDSDYLAVLDFN
jgi:uncharacterized protein YkwD